MSFKQNPPPSRCPALPGTGVLHVHGRDAAAFLQAQSMNDVAALAVGRWQWNGLLTAKGRVVFLFALARVADEGFLLVAPDAGADELKAHLQRFVFRSKLALDAAGALVAATSAGDGGAGDGQLLDGGDGAIGLDLSGEGGARVLWLLPASHPALAPPDEAATSAWRLADLAHGLPRLDPGQREAWTPQMLALERLGAYSLKKGC
jgi:folate-binding Fe-S cluster repair protein YgfZ